MSGLILDKTLNGVSSFTVAVSQTGLGLPPVLILGEAHKTANEPKREGCIPGSLLDLEGFLNSAVDQKISVNLLIESSDHSAGASGITTQKVITRTMRERVSNCDTVIPIAVELSKNFAFRGVQYMYCDTRDSLSLEGILANLSESFLSRTLKLSQGLITCEPLSCLISSMRKAVQQTAYRPLHSVRACIIAGIRWILDSDELHRVYKPKHPIDLYFQKYNPVHYGEGKSVEDAVRFLASDTPTSSNSDWIDRIKDEENASIHIGELLYELASVTVDLFTVLSVESGVGEERSDLHLVFVGLDHAISIGQILSSRGYNIVVPEHLTSTALRCVVLVDEVNVSDLVNAARDEHLDWFGSF